MQTAHLSDQAFQQLRWRCIRRGLLELDLLLTRFLETGYATLDKAEVAVFVELADLEDHDLWDMVTGRKVCSNEMHRKVLEKLRIA